MPGRIRAVSRKGRIFRNPDIFVRGDWGRFGFRTCVGENPAGKAAGETAGNVAANRSRSGRRDGSGQVSGRTRSCFFDFGLRLVRFRPDNLRNGRGQRLSTILGKRLAREKNRFICNSARCRGTGSLRRAMVKAALRRTTRFETTRLAAAIFRAALIAATIVVAARLASARFAALRRSVFGGRQVAAAHAWALRASAAMATATAAPASATATITASVTTTISAAAVILAAAIAAGAWRVILSGIVVGRKILRRGGVRIRLALFGMARVSIVMHFGGVRGEGFVASDVIFHGARLLVSRERIVVRRIIVKRFVVNRFVRDVLAVSLVRRYFLLVRGASVGERFARKQLDDI